MPIVSLLYSIQYCLVRIYFLLRTRFRGKKENCLNSEGISILIPSYDEVLTIKDCIESILNAKRYFPIEIIIVDDGKGSATLNYLKRRYCFERIDAYEKDFKDMNIRHIYMTRSDVRIYVIDKENEGKSKALNTAIRLAHYNYFMSIDGDTIIDKRCLMEMHKLLGEEIIGIGGNIVPARYKGNILGKALCFYQRWEYFRNFSSTRIAYNCLKCVPLMSGALSLFNKKAVIESGGYKDDTLGEDFDLTLKLHEYSRRNGGRIIYTEKAVAYTQVPFDLKSFYKQRLRWQIGFLQVLRKHYRLLIKPSLLSLILNLMNLYESLSVIIILLLMIINYRTVIIFTLFTALASMIELGILKHINDEAEDTNLLVLALFQIIMNIFNMFIRLIGIIKVFILKENITWGRVKRKKI